MAIINKWIRIAIYYLIAITFSFTMRNIIPEWYNSISLPYGFSAYKSWLQGIGPLFGAVVVIWLFRVQHRNTLFGSSDSKSILIGLIPILVLAALGVRNNLELETHYYGFILGFWIVIYGLLEETGWRGYLHDELRGINPVLKYLIIGTLWYGWHFTFLRTNTSIGNELIIYVVLVLASWGLGEIIEKTNSILVAGSFHTIGNIMGLSEVFRTSLASNQKYLVVGLCLLVWIPVLIKWNKKAEAIRIITQDE